MSSTLTAVLAAIRPDEQNFPLLLHVAGAAVLVGGLLTGGSLLAYARSDLKFLRLGYWTLVAVALPGLVIMRIGAQWIYTKQGWDEEGVDEPAWIMIGGVTADIGGAIFVLSLIAGWFGLRRIGEGRGSGLLKGTMWVSIVLLAAYVVAVWAMAAKPD
jgi:hypothetical protein